MKNSTAGPGPQWKLYTSPYFGKSPLSRVLPSIEQIFFCKIVLVMPHEYWEKIWWKWQNEMPAGLDITFFEMPTLSRGKFQSSMTQSNYTTKICPILFIFILSHIWRNVHYFVSCYLVTVNCEFTLSLNVTKSFLFWFLAGFMFELAIPNVVETLAKHSTETGFGFFCQSWQYRSGLLFSDDHKRQLMPVFFLFLSL